ncbi:iron export ABC transporter permease subunit FetB [Metabacillus sp. KIGAM252]|uniref:Iron export ABC transporter permease subunit FetB n=1 Tax=Metabacillus flavus TaxID=2823519 RepID=A0ABS5LEH6_9BACI|nr:iron export ABC transporter permease subunit FetB [Metabacillus flavus]MBS2969135.1 iron export ABC transporter permease subunit FetB [Metabacillus flavus]
MKHNMINIDLWRLIAAYGFIVLLLAIVKRRGIRREWKIIIATTRMSVQLILVGYILTYIFEKPNPFISILIVLIMETFAIINIYRQIDEYLSKKMKTVIAISMFSGSIASLLFFNFVVVHFEPWYEPRYFIPIAGMIIGNSMTGITLGVKNMTEGMRKQKNYVEGALMLGAKPEDASKSIVNSAFDSAILPTLNNMLGMGIVFLPGMMTGQILAGASPLVAIEYQIVVLLSITGSTALCVILFIHLGTKLFFNKRAQLVYKED